MRNMNTVLYYLPTVPPLTTILPIWVHSVSTGPTVLSPHCHTIDHCSPSPQSHHAPPSSLPTVPPWLTVLPSFCPYHTPLSSLPTVLPPHCPPSTHCYPIHCIPSHCPLSSITTLPTVFPPQCPTTPHSPPSTPSHHLNSPPYTLHKNLKKCLINGVKMLNSLIFQK